MEPVMDALLTMLSTSATSDPGMQPSDVQWILGDVGLGPPSKLPCGFIAPLGDINQPGQSTGGQHGVDMDLYVVPILIVQAKHDYLPPIAALAGQGMEQPGYRDLLRLSQNTRAVLRANITLSGLVATSLITEMRPVKIDLDGKVYRGLRLTIQIRQRRGR